MAHAHAADQKLENPGALKDSTALTAVFGIFIVIGLVAFFVAYSQDQIVAWTAYLKAHFFFLAISIAALFFIALEWVVTSMWSAPVRRLAEGFTAYLPVILVSTAILFLGLHTLFPWTHPEHVQGDPVLEGKQGYLNVTFLIIRAVVAVIIWNLFQKKIVGKSLSVDKGADFKSVYESNRRWGVAFIIFFAISFTMFAVDQLMSLDPHFFSTMFGVYIFAGAYQSFFAALAIITIILRRAGYLKNLVNDNHIHDIAKMLFAFTVFWAYTGFAQYMLIWYANMPEETGYFILRFNQGWEFWSISLFCAKFFIPFFVLLPRGNKRCEELVFLTSVWVLVTEYLDLNWMVQPQFWPGGPQVTFADVGVWLGFLGVFGLVVTRFYKKNDLVRMKDPYLADSVFHHHI
ncbi:MAG: molybdopterin oxidoreductase [Bdellovibrionales bacterium]|nr:molybdopterin oxidoreductase [Bdellovibrionales bacterium]